MKKSRLISLLSILLIILAFSLLNCSRTELSENSNLTVKGSSHNDFSLNSASIQLNTNKQQTNSKDLLFLKEWIGKYPINKGNKKIANIFEVPQVKNSLTGILGKDGFQNLLEHFAGFDLIEEKKGFLEVSGTTARNVDQDVDYALLAINLKTGETHVSFVDNQKLTSFSNTKGDGTLPLEIKEKILAYTEQALLIGKIKQKPDEGYICYAVLYEDWDAPQETRPYIFYITDEGGRMSIEGKDVELKLKSENEKKGEGGKTYVDWIYENKDVRARFNMVVSEIPDSSAVVYDGTVIISTYTKMQSAQIKAFCGG